MVFFDKCNINLHTVLRKDYLRYPSPTKRTTSQGKLKKASKVTYLLKASFVLILYVLLNNKKEKNERTLHFYNKIILYIIKQLRHENCT